MEKEENDDIVIITTTTTNSPPPHVPPSKKRRGRSLFQAALFTVRHHRQPDKKARIHANALDSPHETPSIWRSLLCGMRPLHLQDLERCPSFLPQPRLVVDHEILFHDTPLPPPSPACSDDGMSRYASAEDLQALDDSKNGDHEEDATGECRASHSIDMRAEEFIAMFYEQMRIQRFDSCDDGQDD